MLRRRRRQLRALAESPNLRSVAKRALVRLGRRLAREPQPAGEPDASDASTPSAGEQSQLLCWPLDHYYSPVPDNRALARDPARSRVWPPEPRATPDVDWREPAQVALFESFAERSAPEFPKGPTGNPGDYHAANPMFSRLDAWVLQAMLRHFRPHRMIEVGCGWSSLVTARVNREHLNGELDFACVEPYPPEFLGDGIDGISRLIVSRVEELPVDSFLELREHDFLFIDSSHTVKTGGDVAFLFGEVVPRLSPGVIVHVHDIFLPWDYPQDWVFTGRAWNEQYLIRAFMAFNSAFEILLGVGWMSQFRPDVLRAVIEDYPDKYADGGGSLWIRRASDT